MASQLKMFDLRKIPVVKVLIPFAAGALCGSLSVISFNIAGLALACLVGWAGLLCLHWRIRKQSGFLSRLFCCWTFLLCFAAGMAHGWVSRPTDPQLPLDDRVIIRGLVKEASAAGEGSFTCEVALWCLYAPDSLYLCETLLRVYLDPAYGSSLPAAGEIWQWPGKLYPIRNSGNPGSPDFEAIMHRKQCWYRFYPDSSMELHPAAGKILASGATGVPDHMRHLISSKWQGREEEVALLRAVCLGDRQALTQEMRQAYGTAGGMHLLAVSGLHVGLIWWVLQSLTRWMVRKERTEVYRTLAVVGMLWFYASLTGFSASVCRSVTMFSFFSMGRMLGQRTQVLNAIFVSALILLIIKPSWLQEAGFQLSYAAMLGIVAFYPIIRRLFKPKYRLIRWVWEAAAVSLAAQLLTAPLVIYYFHQLPLYSVVTSILAVPMLSLLIALFTCSVPFMIAGLFENILNAMLMALARGMNHTMEAVAALPGALLEDISLSQESLVLIMLFMGLLMLCLQGRSGLPPYLLCVVLTAWMCHGAFAQWTLEGSSRMLICHFRGASMVSFREGRQLDHFCWTSDSSSAALLEKYRSEVWNRRRYDNRLHAMGNTPTSWGSVSACLQLTPGIWMVGNDRRKGWVISGNPVGRHDLRSLIDSAASGWEAPDFILLSFEPRGVSAELLPGEWTSDVVLDGSNRPWYKRHMQILQVPVYDTDRLGAYMKRW